MGLTLSQQEDISLPTLSNESRASLQQVLNAFRRDIPFFVRHHQPRSKTDLLDKQQEEEIIQTKNSSHHRSHSLDEHHSNENKYISRNSSFIKRQWQCQLCQKLNENDSQLCLNCGSSKINVYIPIMNQNDKKKSITDQQHDSSILDR
jgi:hypothetical protein